MLKPELQSMEDFVDGINNIVEAQQKVALNYFEDGSIEAAIPPLKILLHIMAYGHYEGKSIDHTELRQYFNRDFVVNANWYKERLALKQQKDITYYGSQIEYLEAFKNNPYNAILVVDLQINERLETTKKLYQEVKSPDYLNRLVGTIGADPLYKK